MSAISVSYYSFFIPAVPDLVHTRGISRTGPMISSFVDHRSSPVRQLEHRPDFCTTSNLKRFDHVERQICRSLRITFKTLQNRIWESILHSKMGIIFRKHLTDKTTVALSDSIRSLIKSVRLNVKENLV